MKYSTNVKEVHPDPRVDVSIRQTVDELEEGRTRQLSDLLSHKQSSTDLEKVPSRNVGQGPFYLDFEDNDPRDPMSYSLRKKWFITSIASFTTLVAASTSSAFNMGTSSMIHDLNTTEFQVTIAFSLYSLGFALLPLITASFSEEFGRRPLYIGSMLGFLLMYVMIACANNIHTVQIARFLQGACGSTGATMVGGTIADIWAPSERGLPMAIFSLMSIGGNGFGPFVAGWIEFNRNLQWRWIQWIQMIVCASCFLLLPFMGETRSSIILTRIAHRMRKETGDKRYRARVEDERGSLKTLIWISCTRPIYLLFTEPIVASFSLWVAFAWGVLFCLIQSIGSVFSELHGFNISQIGTVFLATVIGSLIGLATNFYQEKLYRKFYAVRGVEARLYLPCLAALFFPVGMFIYAWSCFSTVHWIALIIGITIFTWATYIIYLAVFLYLADCYGPFASSALAGQSLLRNLLGTVFPLFTHQMYHSLGYQWANTMFGCIALVMMPIPFVLFFCGPAIRRRSPFSRKVGA